MPSYSFIFSFNCGLFNSNGLIDEHVSNNVDALDTEKRFESNEFGVIGTY